MKKVSSVGRAGWGLLVLLAACSSTTTSRVERGNIDGGTALQADAPHSGGGSPSGVAGTGGVPRTVASPVTAGAAGANVDAGAAPVLTSSSDSGPPAPSSTTPVDPPDPPDPAACGPEEKYCGGGCVPYGGDFGCGEGCDTPCRAVFYGTSICDENDECDAECEFGHEPAPRLPDGYIGCRASIPPECQDAWVDDCSGYGVVCPGGIFMSYLCSQKSTLGTDKYYCCGS